MQEPLRNTSYNKVGSFNGSIAICSDDLVPEALYIFHSKKIVFIITYSGRRAWIRYLTYVSVCVSTSMCI